MKAPNNRERAHFFIYSEQYYVEFREKKMIDFSIAFTIHVMDI